MTESKHDRFLRIISARTNKVLDMLRLIGKCADRRIYAYTQEDLVKVFDALQSGLSQARIQFHFREGTTKKSFSLESITHDAGIIGGHLMLPDGTMLFPKTFTDGEYPTINLYRIDKSGAEELLCFAEYNPCKEAGHELCIGAYCADKEDTTYYESYL